MMMERTGADIVVPPGVRVDVMWLTRLTGLAS